MLQVFSVLLISVHLAAGPVSLADPRRPNDLRQKIDELIRSSGAERVAVAYRDLSGGRELLINADASFHAASTMKIPVMMEVFRQAQAGTLSLDDPITVKNEFASIVDGSRYQLSPADDSDTSLYRREGQHVTIPELLRLMITVSSNLATNLLIERVKPENVMRLMKKTGANQMRVLRGVEDGKAYERGLNNTTNARDLMILLSAIVERRVVSPAASDEMLKILLDQRFNEGIPSGLPAGFRAAHKTGSITKLYHDAGIIYPPTGKPFILVILTYGLQDETRAHKLTRDITAAVVASRSERN
jgi:beta-lactamase class A